MAGRRSLVIVNNCDETFTDTSSGAIATHIWETSRAAKNDGVAVSLVSRASAEPVLAFEPLVLTARAPGPTLTRRALRRLCSARSISQQDYVPRVLSHLARSPVSRLPVLCHNDPELAAMVAWLFPQRRVVHLMHNELEVAGAWRRLVRHAPVRHLAVSGYIARATETAFGLPRGSVKVVLNGVDAERFSPRETHPRGTTPTPTIGFLGRAGREKGLDVLLAAAALVRDDGNDFALRIIGSNTWGQLKVDDYQRELMAAEDALRNRGVEVTRAGHITRAGVPAELRQLDVLVVPSRWDEPCALTLLEGMATGVVVVASQTGGTPEVLAGTGILFPRDDERALATVLSGLVRDEVVRHQWGSRARARATTLAWAGTWKHLAQALYS